MTHPYFLRVAYVGAEFHGWQIQSALRTAQGELWRALRQLEPDAPLPQGTGRTDAGVHAKAQGVLVRVRKPWDPYRLLAALNAHLSDDLRVRSVQPSPEAFFPRQHAVAKRYVYRLQEGPSADPFLWGRCWHLHGAVALDRSRMAEAARHLLGEHDFSSFRASECAARSPVRHLYGISFREEGAGFELVFEGNRFLMHQVRIMTGTLVEVGKGRREAGDLAGVLEARDRCRAGPTAPPQGLCLEEVWYGAEWGIGEIYPGPSPA